MSFDIAPAAPTARIRPSARSTRTRPKRLRTRAIGSDRAEATARIVEWHAMTTHDRSAAWADLVDWVAWLVDRYELARGDALPSCWAQHPGLIEELWALKVWRADIYTIQPDTGTDLASSGQGQAARYWHGELRQVLAAATNHYARGCRAGHKPTPLVDAATVEEWRNADPLTGIDPTRTIPTPPPPMKGTTMDEATMSDHLARGTARALSPQLTDYARYGGAWWTRTTGSWIRVADPDLVDELDTAADRLAAADTAIAATRQLATGPGAPKPQGD